MSRKGLNFIRKIVRTSDDKVPVFLFSIFYSNKRPGGRPSLTVRNLYYTDIKIIISSMDRNKSITIWAYYVSNELTFSMLINHLNNDEHFFIFTQTFSRNTVLLFQITLLQIIFLLKIFLINLNQKIIFLHLYLEIRRA